MSFFNSDVSRLQAWWRSDASTITGVVSVISGLVGNTAGRAALHDLGVPTAWVVHLASLAVVLGALLITPKAQS